MMSQRKGENLKKKKGPGKISITDVLRGFGLDINGCLGKTFSMTTVFRKNFFDDNCVKEKLFQ